MKLEVEPASAGGHRWRLVITAADLAGGVERLGRRLRVGGHVRAKLDYAHTCRHTALAGRVAPAPRTPAASSRLAPATGV